MKSRPRRRYGAPASMVALFLGSTLGSFAGSPGGEAPIRADVCVYAATPSGINAAVAARREGRVVIIVEPSRWLGGILGAGIKPGQDCPEPRAVGGLTASKVLQFPRNPRGVREHYEEWIRDEQIPVLREYRVASVTRDGGRLVGLELEHAPPDELGVPAEAPTPGRGKTIKARVFIDASYEGDVMARAGVRYAVGRESRDAYGEAPAGVGKPTNVTPIDPYVEPGDPTSGLLRWVELDHGKPLGSADDYTQAYNFRFYVTDDPDRRIEITPPEGWSPAQYEIVGRYVHWLVSHGHQDRLSWIFPGWLNSGEYNYRRESLFSIAPLGVSRHYQDGDYAVRSRIWRLHIDYLRGLHHFLSTDPRIPEDFRSQVVALGLDRTMHPDTRGWPHQLYVRVARRMVGRYVLTHEDVRNRTRVEDSVGLALFGVDTYPVRRIVTQDPETDRVAVATEGNMFIGGNRGTGVPYGIPYRAITPAVKECSNILVPVCFSASYIAYASARMEPVFMVLGESAGVAASQAMDEDVPVQEIDVVRLQARLRELGQVLEWNPGDARSRHE